MNSVIFVHFFHDYVHSSMQQIIQIEYDAVQQQIQAIGWNDCSDQSCDTCGPMFLQFPSQNIASFPQVVAFYGLMHKIGSL